MKDSNHGLKKIVLCGIVGFGFLFAGTGIRKSCVKNIHKDAQYNKAMKLVEKCADKDRVPGLNCLEERSVYLELNLPYDPRSPEKLKQEHLDDYLKSHGYSWNENTKRYRVDKVLMKKK